MTLRHETCCSPIDWLQIAPWLRGTSLTDSLCQVNNTTANTILNHWLLSTACVGRLLSAAVTAKFAAFQRKREKVQSWWPGGLQMEHNYVIMTNWLNVAKAFRVGRTERLADINLTHFAIHYERLEAGIYAGLYYELSFC